MTINHSNCDHASTSSARAKCRRAHANGDNTTASVKTVDFSRNGQPTGKASTPRDRDKQCDNCGVERITQRGTDPLDGIIKYVGDKCSYILRRSDDLQLLDD